MSGNVTREGMGKGGPTLGLLKRGGNELILLQGKIFIFINSLVSLT